MDLTFDGMEHITIDWDKVNSVEDMKIVLVGFFGELGMYTSDDKLKKFAKDKHE